MIKFLLRYPEKVVVPLLQHIELTGLTLLISIVIASALSLLLMRSRWLSQLVVGLFSAVYAIPSMALFALLIPLFGLGEKTAVIVLVIYNQFILVRNILGGFHSVDPAVIESAYGMGMSGAQIFFKIRLPLASPVILAGIKIAAVSTIGIATIGATINSGGLGTLLFEGLQTMNMVKILWGTLLSSLLAIAANLLLAALEKKARKAVNGEG
ncbi:MAG: ABC transporter permease [Oscillospiraceae bacterium]|jgi:osmoprotectant transport system permease protein|nr:ABC transporter permease [Oscillospiraceae bacterium]MCI1991372.1 ABC transporter permease [Oscillospiraceae bacterium]MCI2034659.1 ABC transporter permease [Oscillospiraceae bacterium]